VNEIAPRVHNSGHWTQAAAPSTSSSSTSAPSRAGRSATGSRHADVVMENLIGDDVDRAPALAGERGVQVHLYGKAETRRAARWGM
jgi:5-(carboxyamino)imidazole ribonucleotide synthase